MSGVDPIVFPTTPGELIRLVTEEITAAFGGAQSSAPDRLAAGGSPTSPGDVSGP